MVRVVQRRCCKHVVQDKWNKKLLLGLFPFHSNYRNLLQFNKPQFKENRLKVTINMTLLKINNTAYIWYYIYIYLLEAKNCASLIFGKLKNKC